MLNAICSRLLLSEFSNIFKTPQDRRLFAFIEDLVFAGGCGRRGEINCVTRSRVVPEPQAAPTGIVRIEARWTLSDLLLEVRQRHDVVVSQVHVRPVEG